jgi:23S rRNA (guanosine2251-2'-O)-methyltransferase
LSAFFQVILHGDCDTIEAGDNVSIIIYGKNPVMEALKSGRKIIKGYIMDEQHKDIRHELNQLGVPVDVLDKSAFKSRFHGTSQGIALEVETYRPLLLHQLLEKVDVKRDPLIVMLDGIQDPHNLGAIIRTAEAGGAIAIIIPKNRSAGITAVVVKAASGAIEHIDIVEVTNLSQTLTTLKEAGFWIVGTDLDAAMDYTEAYHDRPVCLIIGNEGKGVSQLLKKHSDQLVKIPMHGKVDSLNASVGAGIIIFDILRRKRE